MRISQIRFECAPEVVAHWYFVVEGPSQMDASSHSMFFGSCLLLDPELQSIWASASDAALKSPGEETQGGGNNIPVVPNLLDSPTPCTKYFPYLS